MIKRNIAVAKNKSKKEVIDDTVELCRRDISQLHFIHSDICFFLSFVGMTQDEADSVCDSLKNINEVLSKYRDDLQMIEEDNNGQENA